MAPGWSRCKKYEECGALGRRRKVALFPPRGMDTIFLNVPMTQGERRAQKNCELRRGSTFPPILRNKPRNNALDQQQIS
jgi:hypothetical protein